MARPVDKENRELMREKIIETSRTVFCQKGYLNVTMTNLVEAAGLSRGGFYFYYQSVADVFRDVIKHRKRSKFAEILKSIEQNPPFEELLDSYLEKQKERLLNMETSLIRALYEYLFTHREEKDVEFRLEQEDNILNTVNAILQLGVEQNKLDEEKTGLMAEHFMYTIEGLNLMALFQGLTEYTINNQFKILKQLIGLQGE